MPSRKIMMLLSSMASALAGCASVNAPPTMPVTLVPRVDLARFMGDWYVIANIPTFVEKGAHNAKEHYELAADGSIPTTFTYLADGFDGTPKRLTSKSEAVPGSNNAVWTVQYVWPFKADYRISYLADDYGQVVVTREKRDYVWIMARTPTIPEADLKRLTDFVRMQGYDVSKLQRVPQSGAR